MIWINFVWSNNIAVLLCEGPKPPSSMISGFLSPGGPLFMDFNNIPNYSNEYKKIWKRLENSFFNKFENLKNEVLENLALGPPGLGPSA